MKLFDYQEHIHSRTLRLLKNKKNICIQAPTGSGKTVMMCALIAHLKNETTKPIYIIAHRQELISQICLTLARHGLKHSMIASERAIKETNQLQYLEFKKSFYDWGGRIIVTGVDTLVKKTNVEPGAYWILDEAHHIQPHNKWGKAAALVGGVGIGYTATPKRGDGASLDSVFCHLITGPTTAKLIKRGRLCDYDYYSLPKSIATDNIKISKSTGDYSKAGLVAAAQKSQIVGDVVEHYTDLAAGKRGITFVTDSISGETLQQEFNRAGVPAAFVTAKTPALERYKINQKFKRGKLLQLINIDLFGEGYDVPDVEVVSLARPTKSLGLYLQQVGRVLRTAPGKQRAIILDHVGNAMSGLGTPKTERIWSLSGKNKTDKKTNEIKDYICSKCYYQDEHPFRVCKKCGHKKTKIERQTPEQVGGRLELLDEDSLKSLKKSVAKANSNPDNWPEPRTLQQKMQAKHRKETLAERDKLKYYMTLWSGKQKEKGLSDVKDRRHQFWKNYGVDVLSAQTLSRTKTIELCQKLQTFVNSSHTKNSTKN